MLYKAFTIESNVDRYYIQILVFKTYPELDIRST